MAKSIRSKWKKKMRAVKRVRYGRKELEKLKSIVRETNNTDVVMNSIAETATDVVTKQKSKDDESFEPMETSNRKFSRRTLRDQNGTYPVWMSQRQIRKRAKSNKRKSKGKKAK